MNTAILFLRKSRINFLAIRGPYMHSKYLPKQTNLVYSCTRNLFDGGSFGTVRAPSSFLRLAESAPVLFAQDKLIYLHDVTGLYWWQTIVLTTLIVRTVMVLPMALHQHYVIAMLENVNEEMKQHEKSIYTEVQKEAHKNGWTDNQLRANYMYKMQMKQKSLRVKYNCPPFKMTLISLIQMPVWVILSCVFRNLVYKIPYNDARSEIVFMELSVGGFLWIKNLTIPDETLILPVSIGIMNLINLQIQKMKKIGKVSRLSKFLNYLFCVLIIAMVFISTRMNSCITLYWAASSLYGVFQNILLSFPRVRKFCRIPKTPTMRKNPLQYAAKKIFGFFSFFKYYTLEIIKKPSREQHLQEMDKLNHEKKL